MSRATRGVGGLRQPSAPQQKQSSALTFKPLAAHKTHPSSSTYSSNQTTLSASKWSGSSTLANLRHPLLMTSDEIGSACVAAAREQEDSTKLWSMLVERALQLGSALDPRDMALLLNGLSRTRRISDFPKLLDQLFPLMENLLMYFSSLQLAMTVSAISKAQGVHLPSGLVPLIVNQIKARVHEFGTPVEFSMILNAICKLGVTDPALFQRLSSFVQTRMSLASGSTGFHIRELSVIANAFALARHRDVALFEKIFERAQPTIAEASPAELARLIGAFGRVNLAECVAELVEMAEKFCVPKFKCMYPKDLRDALFAFGSVAEVVDPNLLGIVYGGLLRSILSSFALFSERDVCSVMTSLSRWKILMEAEHAVEPTPVLTGILEKLNKMPKEDGVSGVGIVASLHSILERAGRGSEAISDLSQKIILSWTPIILKAASTTPGLDPTQTVRAFTACVKHGSVSIQELEWVIVPFVLKTHSSVDSSTKAGLAEALEQSSILPSPEHDLVLLLKQGYSMSPYMPPEETACATDLSALRAPAVKKKTRKAHLPGALGSTGSNWSDDKSSCVTERLEVAPEEPNPLGANQEEQNIFCAEENVANACKEVNIYCAKDNGVCTNDVAHTPPTREPTEEDPAEENPLCAKVVAPELGSPPAEASSEVETQKLFPENENGPDDSACGLLDLLAFESSLRSQQHALTDERREIVSRIAELTETQNEYCAKEEFDRADAIQWEINSLRGELFSVVQELFSAIPEQLDRIVRQQEEVLEYMNSEAQKELDRLTSDYVSRSQSVAGEISALETQIGVFQKINVEFIERELELADQEEGTKEIRKTLQEKIDLECRDLAEAKLVAEQSYAELDALVVSLQAQLAEAMAARSKAAMDVSAAQLQLDTVEAKYADEVADVEQLEKVSAVLRAEIVSDKISLGGGNTEELEQQVREMKENAELTNSQFLSQKERTERFFEQIKNFHDLKRSFTKNRAAVLRESQLVQAEVVSASQTSQLLYDEVASAEEKLTQFRSTIMRQKSKLPSLEEEKKLAIASRSFKEAKELAAEINEINVQIGDAQETLNCLKAGVATARKESHESAALEQELTQRLELVHSHALNEEVELLNRYSSQLADMLAVDQSTLTKIIQEEINLVKLQTGKVVD